MKDIIIVGAGHLGVDVYSLICEINEKSPTWRIKGFLNDFPVDLRKYGFNEGIIGTIKDWQPSPEEYYALAIGSPSAKEIVANSLKSRGAKFATLISPHAIVRSSATIGEGSIIFTTSKIAPCVKIGRFVMIGDSTIAANTKIGDYSNTTSYVNIYQDLQIGKRVQIWSHAIILNNIEDDAIIGAGSVVILKVKKNTRVFGNPAKKLDI